MHLADKNRGWQCHPLSPYYLSLNAGLLPGLGEAVTAVDGSAFSRLKRYLGIYAAGSTDSGMHFPLPLIATIAIVAFLGTAALFPGLSAVIAALGFIGEALVGKELLLRSTKSETCATVYALKGLVLVAHG